MIEIKNIKYSVGNKKILDGINLTIKRGEITTLIGVNGSGKSTVFKAMCGDFNVNSGKIEFDGTNINDINIADMAKKRSVYRQANTVAFDYSTYEIVENGRYIYEAEMSKADNQKIIKKVMQDMNVWKLRNQSYATLSGGEKSRVQLSRVIAQSYNNQDKKPFILLDEPDASMDVNYSISIMKTAMQLANAGYGVFVILHDINLAYQYSDTMYLLDNKKIKSVGTKSKPISVKELSKTYGVKATVLNDKGKKSIFFE